MTSQRASLHRRLSGQRGASSVLILMVLLLLVFLSVLSFVTTGVNLRLAKKNAETVQAWYRMDTAGEQVAARLLRAVRRADEETQAWLEGNAFLQSGQQVLPPATQQALKEQWRTFSTEAEREVFREALYPSVSTVITEQVVERLSLEEVEIVPAERDALFRKDISGTETSFLIRVSDPENMNSGTLKARLVLLPATGAQSPGHLQVMEWKLVQTPFTYDNSITLWEGIVE